MRSVRIVVRQVRVMKQAAMKRSRILRLLALLAPCVVASSACDRPQYTYSDDVPVKGSAASSFGGGFTGSGGSTSAGGGPADACALDRTAGGSPIFSKQAINNQMPARSTLFLEVNDAEAEALKNGASLLPKPADPVAKSALTSVLNSLLTSTSELRRPLIQALLTRFKVTRAIWPNPWALRLVDHPGTEHMTPVRVVLNKDAWVVRIVDGSPVVLDLNNADVTIDAALAQPERIAAVYYVVDDRVPGNLTGMLCEHGKRELALGSEAMVDSFELRTPEILARLNSDIDALNALFKVARPCSNVDRGGVTFHAYTACQTWHYFDATTEYTSYQWSLSDPVELYKPTAQNLATLIEALQGDRFAPDSFVGTPPAGGAGGAADIGGAQGFPQGGT
jgi:hypothetical protein